MPVTPSHLYPLLHQLPPGFLPQTEKKSIIVWKTAILSSFHLSLQSDVAGTESTISPMIDTGKINAVL